MKESIGPGWRYFANTPCEYVRMSVCVGVRVCVCVCVCVCVRVCDCV